MKSKRKYWGLPAVLFALPILMGQGCPGVTPANPLDRARSICAQELLVDDVSFQTIVDAARTDRRHGFSVDDERTDIVYHCEVAAAGYSSAYLACCNCGFAIIDAVYVEDPNIMKAIKSEDETSGQSVMPAVLDSLTVP